MVPQMIPQMGSQMMPQMMQSLGGNSDLFTPQQPMTMGPMNVSLEQQMGQNSLQQHPLMQQLSNSITNNPYMMGGDDDSSLNISEFNAPDITKKFFF